MSSHLNKNIDYEESTSVSDVHSSVKREKGDPQTGLEPATIPVFVVCAIVLMVGGAYLGAHGGFNGESVLRGYVPVAPGGEGETIEKPPLELWLANGKDAYSQCAGCHMLDGKGKPGQYPPLAGSDWVTGGTDRLASLILHGLKGPITVNGQSYAGTDFVMPDHKSKFTPEQIAQVMTYIRSSWGNQVEGIVTTEMVQVAIDQTADRTTPYTNDELPAPDVNLPGEQPEWAGGAPADSEGSEPGEGTAEVEPAA